MRIASDLEKALIDAFDDDAKAKSVFDALNALVDEKIDDLYDRIKERGRYDRDY
jgi:arylsulfatase A-like enzyme